MGVYIKGLKMPKHCWQCAFKDCDDNCAVMYAIERKNISVFETWGEGRVPNWCPLVELPDHGDLIEREYAIGSACSGRIRALPTTEDGEDWIRVEEVRQSIKSVPAVIPADRSEDGET